MDGSGRRPARAEPALLIGGRAGATFATGAAAALAAEVAPPHYAGRIWALRSEASRTCSHLLVLNRGSAAILEDHEDAVSIAGPTLCWLPAACGEYLKVEAGTCAHILRLQDGVWHRYVSPSAEEAYLDLAKARQTLLLPSDGELAATISCSIAAMAAELATPARAGAVSIISAELTLCLLRVWRLIARDDASPEGNSAEILVRFRRLVEEHYRSQLRVADFASLLGISADRLHALCTRVLKRSPSALIQQRVVQEAVLRLETSGATVKQIAFALGFKDTAYFSRFFSKHTGASPGAWRRTHAARGEAGKGTTQSLDFADWP